MSVCASSVCRGGRPRRRRCLRVAPVSPRRVALERAAEWWWCGLLLGRFPPRAPLGWLGDWEVAQPRAASSCLGRPFGGLGGRLVAWVAVWSFYPRRGALRTRRRRQQARRAKRDRSRRTTPQWPRGARGAAPTRAHTSHAALGVNSFAASFSHLTHATAKSNFQLF